MARKSFAVIGMGRFGQSVVVELINKDVDVLVIDRDPERIARMSQIATHAVTLDTTDVQALKEVGISSIDCVVVAIGKDLQSSILTTLILKDLGVETVIVKVQNADHAKVVEKLGADEIIQPEQQSGKRLASKIVSDNVLDYIDLNESHSFIVVNATTKIIDSTIINLDVRNKFKINVVAIRRGEDVIIPNADTVIEQEDQLLLIGNNTDLDKFNNWLRK
ncbi:potassium channel family protein [Candidatus Xianfuyuplasma coldseepsis]|uniref:TrkA family potassium uptake protein n=1 Tax=Candidatus Xianfuyuplasma coldseepsis TaxID=2782163 RepID=A0A7L7KUK5_9MOLU|nr:TrkA family potassium uptake protein [Xianfuyuplasma coldseepsis]QMS85674.1 TrkA family potassium uptake protein [Xianfuyuplasma coldseepsis]